MLKTFVLFLILFFRVNISFAQQIVDLLVAYTPSVISYTGSDAETISIIKKAVNDANLSFTSSGISLQYNLVKIVKLTYYEGTHSRIYLGGLCYKFNNCKSKK